MCFEEFRGRGTSLFCTNARTRQMKGDSNNRSKIHQSNIKNLWRFLFSWPFCCCWYCQLLLWPCSLNAVVLNLYKHAETLCTCLSFCRTPFLPNITESKNGSLHLVLGIPLGRFPVGLVSRTCLAVEPRLRTTALTRMLRPHSLVPCFRYAHRHLWFIYL